MAERKATTTKSSRSKSNGNATDSAKVEKAQKATRTRRTRKSKSSDGSERTELLSALKGTQKSASRQIGSIRTLARTVRTELRKKDPKSIDASKAALSVVQLESEVASLRASVATISQQQSQVK